MISAGQGPARWRALVVLTTIYSLSLAAVFYYNWRLFGSITGSVAGVTPSWNAAMFAPQFFGFRSGILTYAPIWLLSFSGLLVALWKRSPWALPSLMFLLLLLMTSSLGTQGESYPARFWVQAVPVLALCLLGFIQGTLAKPLKAVVYGSLLAVSLANSFLFFKNLDLHLSARSGTPPYDRLFEFIPSIHLGFWLNLFDQPHVRTGIIVFCLIATVAGALASITRSSLAGAAALLLLALGFEAHRTRPLKVLASFEGPDVVALVTNIPRPRLADIPVQLQVLAPWREDLRAIVVHVTDGDSQWGRWMKESSVLYRKRKDSASSLSIRVSPAPGSGAALPATADREFKAIASKSFWARFWRSS
jgi:hypothetical protein